MSKGDRDGSGLFKHEDYNSSILPDFDDDFVNENDIQAFVSALAGPDSSSGVDDASSPSIGKTPLFITALNDWRPVYQRVRKDGSVKTDISNNPKKKKRRRPPRRDRDETREGFVYLLLKWPFLILALAWIMFLGVVYLIVRLYIMAYENLITLRGKRDQLRQRMRSAISYDGWVNAAQEMDKYLGTEDWKKVDEYAYYNSNTVRNVTRDMRKLRTALDGGQLNGDREDASTKASLAEELKTLLEASVKNNFVGVENARLYSETYFGTKDLVQSFFDEVEQCLDLLTKADYLKSEETLKMFQQLYTNYGRTALCLSGGATFAYYHFGVAKALLDAGRLPQVITGTSGGALVASLLATRTDEELKKLLKPALADRIDACSEPFSTWFPRWWKTGARFDAVDWARRCSWFCRGSDMTFREAYERTGRILNVTCIPSDPHSPTVLANYLTAPDCAIFSAVLASAAVPGILNPVVLMRKTRTGKLVPYSFGHKWKDGSLRTDVPLKALNTHFNVNFSIVSQVNPHINLFFFSSRGSVGRPVTHRRGRGWRGGFLGSAAEQYLKLDLNKWLKVLRHLELLPRPLGQDWSQVWLQRFSGTITIWPRSRISDFYNILSDPTPSRLARMIFVGQQSTFPVLKFISNRMRVEAQIEEGFRAFAEAEKPAVKTVRGVFSEEDLQGLIQEARKNKGVVNLPAIETPTPSRSPNLSKRLSGWWSKSNTPLVDQDGAIHSTVEQEGRRSSLIFEIERQSSVFFDDDPADIDDSELETWAYPSAEVTEDEHEHEQEHEATHLNGETHKTDIDL